MEYTLQSISRLNYSDIKDLMECEKQNLESFLPEIDLELITKIGSLPSQKEAPDTTEENLGDFSE